MSVQLIIQARSGSTRLPGKISLPLLGKTVLERLLERVKKCQTISGVTVATTCLPEDAWIRDITNRLGCLVYFGSEDDVLDRYWQAAALSKCEHIVRVTGDCPLIDPLLIDEIVTIHKQGGFDYTSNTIEIPYPDGMDIEVFTSEALEVAWHQATLPSDREHVTPYIKYQKSAFTTRTVNYEGALSNVRLTLDHEEDYQMINSIFETLYPVDNDFGLSEIEDLVMAKPELLNINAKYCREEGYRVSLTNDPKIQSQKTHALYKRAKDLIPGGTQLLSKRPEMFAPNHWPAYYKKANGVMITDLDDNQFLDMSYMGIGACTLGYADEDVDAAAVNAIKNGSMATLNVPAEVELAELLIELHPWAESVKYTRSGGEAMASAVRIARAASGKNRVMFCGYHGWHDWYLSSNLGSRDKLGEWHLLPGLEPLGIPEDLANSAVPFKYNDKDQLVELLNQYDGSVGVVVIEVVRNIQPDIEFFKLLRDECTRRNIVLIFDEITSGFRLTLGGAHKLFGVTPDVAVFAKTISNGYPLAAIIGKKDVMENAQRTFISSLNWTEAIGPAAALATIKKMARSNVFNHTASLGNEVQNTWLEVAKSSGLEISITGSVPQLSLFGFTGHNAAKIKTLYVKSMLSHGILSTTAFYPALAHSSSHIERYSHVLRIVFGELAKAIDSGQVDAISDEEICHSGFNRLN